MVCPVIYNKAKQKVELDLSEEDQILVAKQELIGFKAMELAFYNAVSFVDPPGMRCYYKSFNYSFYDSHIWNYNPNFGNGVYCMTISCYHHLLIWRSREESLDS